MSKATENGSTAKTTVDRRTISIPPELSKRMAKFKNENWSAVACRAFEQRMSMIEFRDGESLGEVDIAATLADIPADMLKAAFVAAATMVKLMK